MQGAPPSPRSGQQARLPVFRLLTSEIAGPLPTVTGGAPLVTGISVNPGQLLTITASPDDTWSSDAGNRTSNANGLGNPLGDNFGLFKKGDFEFLFGRLVGSLDGGKTRRRRATPPT